MRFLLCISFLFSAPKQMSCEMQYIPPRLWRDHTDREVRAFYGSINDRTRKVVPAAGEDGPAHAVQILKQLDGLQSTINV